MWSPDMPTAPGRYWWRAKDKWDRPIYGLALVAWSQLMRDYAPELRLGSHCTFNSGYTGELENDGGWSYGIGGGIDNFRKHYPGGSSCLRTHARLPLARDPLCRSRRGALLLQAHRHVRRLARRLTRESAHDDEHGTRREGDCSLARVARTAAHRGRRRGRDVRNYEREIVMRRLREPGPFPHEIVQWAAEHKRARKAVKLLRDTQRTEDGRRKGRSP